MFKLTYYRVLTFVNLLTMLKLTYYKVFWSFFNRTVVPKWKRNLKRFAFLNLENLQDSWVRATRTSRSWPTSTSFTKEKESIRRRQTCREQGTIDNKIQISVTVSINIDDRVSFLWNVVQRWCFYCSIKWIYYSTPSLPEVENSFLLKQSKVRSF